MPNNFFPQRPTITPTIYAYRLLGVDTHKGYLKVGYTDRTAKERIEEQLHTSKVQYEIVLVESAMSNDGSCFTDKDVHRVLESRGYSRLNPLDKTDEWFCCSALNVKAAILSLRELEKKIADWAEYAREIIWFGKRRSATICTNARENITVEHIN